MDVLMLSWPRALIGVCILGTVAAMSCSPQDPVDAEVEALLIYHAPTGTGTVYQDYAYIIQIKEVLKQCGVLDVIVVLEIAYCPELDTVATKSRGIRQDSTTTADEAASSCPITETIIEEMGYLARSQTRKRNKSYTAKGTVEKFELVSHSWGDLVNCINE